MTIYNKGFDRRGGSYALFPITQLCGKWLQDSGFKAGHTIDTVTKGNCFVLTFIPDA